LRAYTQTTPTLFNKQTKLGMGYDTSRLVDAAPEQLLCGVCLDVFARPVVICAELHTLCKSCTVGIKPRKCPCATRR
jgi:hypothetical protein